MVRKPKKVLKAVNLNFQALFNNNTFGLAYCQTIFDNKNIPVDYLVLDINNTYERFVGVNKENIIGRKISDAFPGVSQDLIDKHNRVAVTGEESHFEIYEPTKGMWFDVNVFSPQKGYFIALFYNVTKNKQAEIAKQESEERLIIALEAADLGTWAFDLDTGIAIHSLRHDQIFGYRELQSEWSYEISIRRMLPEFHHVARDAVSNAIKTGNLYFEAKILWPDGSIHWIAPTGRVQYDDTGQPIRISGVVADITERKQSEESLRTIERRYSALFSNKINGMAHCKVIYDESGKPVNYRILEINEAYERIIGIKKADIEGRLATEAFPDIKNYKIDYIGMYGKLALERSEIKFEEFFEASQQYLSIYAYSPEPGEFVALFTDVTDRITTEKKLSESEAKYRNIVETAGEGIIISNTDGCFQFVNQKFADILGYTPAELIGRKSHDFMYDNPEVSRIIQLRKHLKKGETLQDTAKWCHKNGSVVWTQFNATPLFDSQGIHTSNLVMHTNITARKQAEIKLKEAQDKLNMALDKGNIGIWEWNFRTEEVSWDERLEKMFGLEPGTFGKTMNAFESLVNEEDISHIQIAIKNALEKDLPFETVFRTRSKDKKTKYISSKALINKDNVGNPVSMIGVCFDVTGLKVGTEQVISKLNEELLCSNKELESFAYVASHDLQEPLRMVSSFTQLLERQYKDKLDDKALDYIHFAVDGSKRMYDLLNGLLSYSRIHTKGKEFRSVELNHALEDATKNLALIIKEKNVVIKSDELPVVTGDYNQMVQLFQNLISNSIKFSQESPRIYISSKSDNDHYLISVKDEGIGIETQYSEKIFQIFQKLHTREQYEGRGIGLAICKRIVERHGGRIWVDSEFEKGSTFFFTIPKETLF